MILTGLAAGLAAPASLALPLLAQGNFGANPISTLLLLVMITLLPFVLMMSTSFLKFAVVLSILRTAMGTQQVPPTPVIMGLAIILSIYVMAPIGAEMGELLGDELTGDQQIEVLSGSGARSLLDSMGRAREPLRRFLLVHAHPDDVTVFLDYARTMYSSLPGKEDVVADSDMPQEDDMLVLIPAFAISELSEAFAIGFLLFLPFLIIDMVVASVLLAMGMHMLSPVVVSLPFKLPLFVMIDGWRLITQGLMQTYIT